MSSLTKISPIPPEVFYNRKESDYDTIQAELNFAKRLAFAQKKKLEFQSAEKKRKQFERSLNGGKSPIVKAKDKSPRIKKTPNKSSSKKIREKSELVPQHQRIHSSPSCKKKLNNDSKLKSFILNI